MLKITKYIRGIMDEKITQNIIWNLLHHSIQ